jgi:hypothetical protein
MHTMKLRSGETTFDRTPPEPHRQQLGTRDDPVLSLGKTSDGVILPPSRLENLTRNRHR